MTGETSERGSVLRGLIKDRAFILALVVILPFVYFTGVTLTPTNIAVFKDIAPVWGAWVGSVIGYFFGARQVEALTERVNAVLNDLTASYDSYEAELDDAEETAEELEDDYNAAVDDMQLLLTKYCQNLPTDLQERLKNAYGVIV
jgi:hypothetical protein